MRTNKIKDRWGMRHMKFKEMKYERVDMNDVIKQFEDLITKFKAATSAEEEFEVHKEYYKVLKSPGKCKRSLLLT